ncbi:unnamed protein product [Rotaria sordida]|uniref:Uncharacterized protein n=1 Tax=Rotaria sordida TaxID=392033 RepID=A0A815XJM7_9BILA|nr:unnamed protein product [Rotaria sordida]
MNNLQLKLDAFWNKNKSSNNCVTHPTENEIHMLLSSSFPSLETVEAQTRTCENEFIFSNEVIGGDEVTVGGEVIAGDEVTVGGEVIAGDEVTVGGEVIAGDEVTVGGEVIVGDDLTVGDEAEVENGLVVRNDAENEDEIKIINEPSCNKSLSSKNDQNKNSSVGVKECCNKKIKPVRSNHRTKYKSSWELLTDAQYKTYIFDHCGERQEKFSCWLYYMNNSMHCRLCEKFGKTKNTNGKDNVWCGTGMSTISLDKIKLHKDKSDVHKQAEDQELIISSQAQPDWYKTQQQQFRVNLLPAEVSGVTYRNDTAALCFLQHIAAVLHQDLIEKIKNSTSLGMLPSDTSG